MTSPQAASPRMRTRRRFLQRALAAATLLSGLVGHAGDTYLEGRLGALRLSDLSGRGDIESVVGLVQLTGSATGHLSYEDAATIGAEIGIAGLFGSSWRIGASLDAFEPDLRSATLMANLYINGVPLADTPNGVGLSSDAVADLGLDFSHRMALLRVSGYYDLDLGDIKPYIGPATACCW